VAVLLLGLAERGAHRRRPLSRLGRAVCAEPNRVAGGWCAVAELRRIGRERDEIAAVVPSTAVFSEAGAAWRDGLEVAKRWIDVRLEQSA